MCTEEPSKVSQLTANTWIPAFSLCVRWACRITLRRITYVGCKSRAHLVSVVNTIKSSFVRFAERQTHPGWFVPMVPPNTAGPPVPFSPPPGFLEYLSILVQNGSLPPLTDQTPVPPTPPVPGVPPSSKGRSFTRPGRGQGGALVDKQKASREVTAAARKRKSLVESDVEIQPPLTSGSTSKNSSGKPAMKRLKTGKVGPHSDPL